jgi:hypothetical protein
VTDDVKRGFKRKTIIRSIKHKMRQWLDSITDEALRGRVEKHYFVSGGAIASMLMGDLPNDYDVYLTDLEVAKDLAGYYLAELQKVEEGEEQSKSSDLVSRIEARVVDGRVRIMIKSAGVLDDEYGVDGYRYFEALPPAEMDKYIDRLRKKKGKDFKPALATSNAISLHGGVQIIFRFVGTPDKVHENFDFVHCTGYFWPAEYLPGRFENGLVIKPEAMEAILARELRYVGSLYPICSMFRIKKFLNRGWTVTAGTMLKIAWDISQLELQYPSVMQDQLVGMDAAYFHQVIQLLKEKGEIDRTYLYEIVERVFDTDEFNTEWMDIE